MARNPRIPGYQTQYDRDLILRDAQGVVTETLDHRTGVASVSATASGQQRANIAPVLAGDTINNLAMYCDSSAGVGVSLFKMGVWNVNGILLAQTPDLSASLAINSWINSPLTTPLDGFDPGLVQLGFVVVYVTTPPSFRGASNPGNNWMKLPNGFQFGLTTNGKADIGDFNQPPGTGTQTYYVVAW